MADQQLLAGENRAPNGSIVASSPPPHYNDIDKLKNNSNGDVNSIYPKIGNSNMNSIGTGAGTGNNTTKVIYEFSSSQNPNEVGTITSSQSFEPPDGGARAWCVMVAGFFCNSIIFGIINTCGTIYVKLFDYLKEMNVEDAASKASLVGSLALGCTFFLSPVSGILTDKIGLRSTTFIGGVLMTAGMILSSMFYHNIQLLYLTYGVMFGLGAALAYTPTIAIMGHYFKRYLGVASGFATCGSSLFTVILPPVLTWMLDAYGLPGTFMILGISSAGVIFCSLVYKPLRPPPPPPKRKPGQSSTSILVMHLKSLVHVENFKRKRYIIWALSMPIALLGYFVPYVHMPTYVQQTYPGYNKDLPIMCIGMTSGLGRLFFGYIADFKWINRVLLQTVSFALLGLLMIAIPFVELVQIPLIPPFYILLAIALGMGIVDGCFITLIGPVAYDICGAKGAAQAIGFLLGLTSIPITVGPPIAGFLFDQTKSYQLSFIMAGIPALFGAAMMTCMRCLRDERVEACDKQEDQLHVLLNKPAWTEDIMMDIKEKNGNSYTFHKMNGSGGSQSKTVVLSPETTEFQFDGHNTSHP